MGAGKSTAARSAAAALGIDAVDVDSVIEERLGKPIHDVFAEDGEGAFRAAEERITLELLNDPGGRRARARRRRRRPRQRARGARRSPGGLARHRARRRLGAVRRQLAPAGPRPRAVRRASTPSASRCTRVWPTRSCRPRARTRWGACSRRSRGCPRGTKMLWAAGASGDYPAYIGPGLLTGHRFWPAARRRAAVRW